ncbi:MAG: DsbC family protein [Nitrospiria bacterium]
MKRSSGNIVLSFWIDLIALVFFFGNPVFGFADEIPPLVRKALPHVEIQSIGTIEIGSPIYTIVTPQGVLYLDGSGRYLFTGDLYDLVTQENLTEARRAGLRRIDFDELPLSDAILYRRGRHRIAVFADPDCPFCRKLHPELEGLDAEVYIFLYPLTDLHPLAYRKSVSAWCSTDRIRAIDTLMAGESIPVRDCDHPVDRTLRLAGRLGLRATPTIILGDGKVIEGYRPAMEITRMLDKED